MNSLEQRRKALKVAFAAFFAFITFRPIYAQPLSPTPPCDDADEPTARQTAGPFYKPKSPKRSSLIETGETATPFHLSGRVLTTQCTPVPDALIDVWHADKKGEYDLKGFRYRGHVFADKEGRYTIETIKPGLYEGRTRHFHVRVQHPNGTVLTTQLYFPGEAENARDFLFDRRLLLQNIAQSEQAFSAHFDFVLKA